MEKTGTHSIANLLGPNRHGYHEEHAPRMLRLITAYHRGETSLRRLTWAFRLRDALLFPHLDVAHYYGAVAAELADDIFPAARFIITIRDCYSWAQSTLNQLVKRWSWKNGWESDSDHFVGYHRLLYGYAEDWSYPRQESVLEEMQIPPLDPVFRHWAERNERLLAAIPPDRRIVIRTHEIGASIPKIAQFLGVSEEHIRRTHSHSFQRKRTFVDLFGELGSEYLTAVAEPYCGVLMDEWFPDRRWPLMDDSRVAG